MRHLLADYGRPGVPYRSRLTTDGVTYKLDPLQGSTGIYCLRHPVTDPFPSTAIQSQNTVAVNFESRQLLPVGQTKQSYSPQSLPCKPNTPANTRSRPDAGLALDHHRVSVSSSSRPQCLEDTIGRINIYFIRLLNTVFCREKQISFAEYNSIPVNVFGVYSAYFDLHPLNLFTTIHDGNFRRHSSMNVTIK